MKKFNYFAVLMGRLFYLREVLRMAKQFAEAFYNSKAWKKCRAAYIAERMRIRHHIRAGHGG